MSPGRYERQGVLVEKAALEKAEMSCWLAAWIAVARQQVADRIREILDAWRG